LKIELLMDSSAVLAALNQETGGELVTRTKEHGLSLGDRVGVKVRCIR
jgi:PIN domain nuclease of toxin-antitoxin system